MKFIKLTKLKLIEIDGNNVRKYDATPVFVNAEKITQIFCTDGISTVCFEFQNYMLVSELPEQIIQMIGVRDETGR